MKPCLVIGHRGASALLPENTLEAFRLAFETFQSDMIEFDIQKSRDGIPVVIHDATLDRTTNGSGLVSDYSLEELKKLDAGYHFDPDGNQTFPHRGKGIQIPALEEVFRAFPKKQLAVELKSTDPDLMRRIIRLVHHYNRLEQTILGSLEDVVYHRILNENPGTRIFSSRGKVWRLLAEYWLNKKNPAPEPWLVASLPVKNRYIDLTKKNWIDWLHAKGAAVYYWTVNDPQTAKRLLAAGADGVMSDNPGILNSVLR